MKKETLMNLAREFAKYYNEHSGFIAVGTTRAGEPELHLRNKLFKEYAEGKEVHQEPHSEEYEKLWFEHDGVTFIALIDAPETTHE